MARAAGFLSDDLDSTLEARMMLYQNIKIHSVNFMELDFVPLFSRLKSPLRETNFTTAFQIILQYSGPLPELAVTDHIHRKTKRNFLASFNPSMSANFQRK
jgi:hypothetical protein